MSQLKPTQENAESRYRNDTCLTRQIYFDFQRNKR